MIHDSWFMIQIVTYGIRMRILTQLHITANSTPQHENFSTEKNQGADLYSLHVFDYLRHFHILKRLNVI